MRDKKKPPQPASECMDLATEQLQRLLSQQRTGGDGDDLLSNPELEKLFGSLSKGLDQGIDDGALAPTTEPLTLEALVATLEQPLASPSAPPAKSSPGGGGECHNCGTANPASTRFCGMCGVELGKKNGKPAGNHTRTSLPEPPTLAQISSTTSSTLGFKMAVLAGLILVLAGAVYQQQMWHMPFVAGLISNVRSRWTEPAPAPTPASPEAPVSAQQPEPRQRETVVIRTPNIAVGPSKPSATIIRHGLAEPAQVVSAPLAQEIPVPPLPAAAPAAEPAAPTAQAAAPPAAETLPAPAPERPAPQPPKTSQAVPAVLIFKVSPEYPSLARAARVQGEVVMHATIGVDGTVQQLRLLSGNPLLVNAAMQAVKKWRYRPSTLDGAPVEDEADITLTFKGE